MKCNLYHDHHFSLASLPSSLAWLKTVYNSSVGHILLFWGKRVVVHVVGGCPDEVGRNCLLKNERKERAFDENLHF